MDSPDTTPIPIPSEDNAWQDMRDRLDKEMPVSDPGPAIVSRNSFPGKMLWTLSTVLLITLATLLLRKALTQSLLSGRRSAGSAAVPSTIEKSVAATPSPVGRSIHLSPAEKSIVPSPAEKSIDPAPANKSTAPPASRRHPKAQPLLQGQRTPTTDERDKWQASSRAGQVPSLPPIQEVKTEPTPLFSSHRWVNIPEGWSNGSSSGGSAKHRSTIHLDLPDTLYLTFGLQLTEEFPFDFGSNGYYFMGIQGRPRYYRALLPSAWMQVQLNKSILGIELNPFYSQNVGKGLSSGTSSVVVGDTTIGTSTSMVAVKVFGLSTSIDYLGYIGGHWWAGAGLRADWWINSVARNYTIMQKQTPSGFSSITESINYAPMSSSDWRYVPSFQLDLLGEILYKRGISQAGFRLSASPNAGQTNFNSDFFFEGELFYRLLLFSKKVYLRDP